MFKRRILLEWGWAEAGLNTERIGDRLVPSEIDVHFEGVDQPSLDMRFAVVAGVPQCRELHLVSKDDGREVRPIDLEAVRLSQWVEDVFGMFAARITSEVDGEIAAVITDSELDRSDAAQEMHRARKGKVARRLTPTFLANVASIYKAALEAGENPTEAVRRSYGVKHRTAANYVQRARKDKHLGPTSRGKKGA